MNKPLTLCPHDEHNFLGKTNCFDIFRTNMIETLLDFKYDDPSNMIQLMFFFNKAHNHPYALHRLRNLVIPDI